MAYIDGSNILAHRGLWQTALEQNSEVALITALESGFGVETDLRDHDGQVAISHDPLPKNADFLNLERLQQLIVEGQFYNQAIALNVKSDGLQGFVESVFADIKEANYFFFDFAVPDGVIWMKRRHRHYTRISKYEPLPALYEQASGLWVDCFDTDWSDFATLDKARSDDKNICFVSPELHGRQPHRMWAEILAWIKSTQAQNVMLCTDLPEAARDFFA